MSPELRHEIVRIKRAGASPRQIVIIMRARGVEITTEAVRCAVITQRWKDRENARRKRQAETRKRHRENLKREQQAKAEQAERAMTAELRARYLRFGCRVTESGKVKLPRMTGAAE